MSWCSTDNWTITQRHTAETCWLSRSKRFNLPRFLRRSMDARLWLPVDKCNTHTHTHTQRCSPTHQCVGLHLGLQEAHKVFITGPPAGVLDQLSGCSWQEQQEQLQGSYCLLSQQWRPTASADEPALCFSLWNRSHVCVVEHVLVRFTRSMSDHWWKQSIQEAALSPQHNKQYKCVIRRLY